MEIINIIDWLSAPATVSVMGVLVVLAYAMHNTIKHNHNPMIMYWAGVWGILGALIGGRILSIIFSPTVFQYEFASWSLLVNGNRSVIGAFIGSGLTGMLYRSIEK